MKYVAQDEVQITQSWLGTLPNGWVTKRLKYISTINDETLPETTDPDYEMLYVDIGSVDATEGIQKKEPMIFETAPSRARRVVQDGDTIVSTVRTYLRAVAPIRNPEQNLIVSTGFAVIRPKGINSHYLAYSLRSSYFIETVVSRSVGVSYPATNPTDVSCIELPLPPVDEQQSIARFLDAKTAQIDALVAQKRQLIDKLKEKRQALIARTVTRGLPPEAAKAAGLETNPEMTDSGVDWLGAVPERWKVLPLRRLIKFVKTGNTPTGAEDHHFEEGGFNWYSPSDFSEDIYLKQANRALSADGKAEIRIFPGKTVMLVGIGATIGKVGLALDECSCNQQINAIGFDAKLDPVFATYYLKILRDFIVKCGKYTTLPIINQDETKNLIFTVPPLVEQSAIAAYLDRETLEIDRLSGQVDSAIDRLTEYRQALITSAVTGKIDVRELA